MERRTNKHNSSWSPKALMKREFSSLSENFSPLQRLACISKVTASVCSFVCVCVLLLSCCLGCESGWRVCRGHKERVCAYAYDCMRLCVCEWMNPRWAWTAAWATKAHTRAQREMAGRRCQPFGPARGSRGPCVFVYICMYVCLCVIMKGGREGGGDQTCLPTN